MMYDVNIFENLHFCLSTRKREASVFKKEKKRCVFGDCFHWIRVDGLGQTGDKNPHFQTKTDMCVDAWGYVLQQ